VLYSTLLKCAKYVGSDANVFFFYDMYKLMSDQTALSLKESIYTAQGAGAVTARLGILVLQFVQAQV